MVFSISKPFRQPLYTNLWFSLCLVICLGFSGYIVMSPHTWVNELFDLKGDISFQFRLICIVVVVANALVSYVYEKIIIWYVTVCWKNRKDRIKMRQQQKEISN